VAVPIDLGAAEALIRARLVAIVNDVVGVSDKVHDYWRNIRDESTRNALLKDGVSGALHAWFVSLAFDQTLTQERDGTLAKDTLLYDIHGYYAVNDANASEKVFARKVLDLVTKLNGIELLALNGDPLVYSDHPQAGIRNSGPAQVPEFNSGDITGVLVHHARIQIPVVFSAGAC
jgi:hypothetical protein